MVMLALPEYWENCCKKLINIVDNLEEGGTTALGPAVVLALGMASDCPGSKIMVCTDGQANEGLGDVSSKSPSDMKRAKETYDKIGKVAKENGITINVISIRGDDACLEYLGNLADLTSGTVAIVDPLDLSKQVMDIMSKPILGTGVTCKVVLDQNFHFTKNRSNKDIREIGNATSDSDLTFGFECKKPFDEMKNFQYAYAQTHITFVRPDGARITRIYTKKIELCSDRDKFESNIDSSILALRAVQYAAELAQLGDYQGARVLLISCMRLLQRGMKTKKNQQEYIQYIIQGEKLDGFMRHAKAQLELLDESKLKMVGTGAKIDDSAAKNIVQMKQASLRLFTY